MQVDLQGLGLASKWPKLLKLEGDRANFKRRYERAAQKVNTLTAHVPRARAADLDAEAAAVRQGRRPPESTREADAKRDLEAAIRERDILERTVQAVEEEYGAFMAQHQSALFRDVLRGRDEIGREAAKRAREALSAYSKWADMAPVIKGLTPAAPMDENAPARRTTNSFIGLHTTQRGVNRGDIEAALAYLIGLGAEDQEGDDAAA